jgi:hypothetical protein
VAERGRKDLMADHECVHCKKTDDETSLHKCPICFKYYCNEHAYLMSGRTFCSQPCAEFFFFSDADE